ncbi:C40 family peptidase [Nakamurella sp. GG22]
MKQLLAAGLGAVLVPVLALSVLVAVLFGSDDDAAAAAAVPGGQTGVVCAPAPAAGSSEEREVAGFSGNQLDVAAAIVAQGKALGVPERGWVVAVATAMQESTLRTLNYGDTMPNGRMSSSRGPFQQLDAWGPLQDRLDPAKSAAMFYTGGKAGQPGLLDIPGWQQLPITVAAQRVQLSNTPDAFAKWEQPANQVVGAVQGRTCTTTGGTTAGAGAAGGSSVSLPGNPRAQTVINRALAQLGVTYAWGGGDAAGPTLGIRDGWIADAHGDYAKVGFDCSGLALYAYAGIGVSVPHQTQAIWAAFGHLTDRAALQPGDLLLYSGDGTAGGIHHVGIYLGGDRMVEAPQSGDVVKISDGIWGGNRGSEFIGAVRPGA